VSGREAASLWLLRIAQAPWSLWTL